MEQSQQSSAVDVDVSDLGLAEKVGQLFQVGFHGTEQTDTIRELVADYHVGGVIYFSRNVETPTQTARLSRALQETAADNTGIPLVLSADQEGGVVSRVPFGTAPPGQMALGAADDPALAHDFGAAVGRQLHAVGINANFAPVLDVNNNPDNPVIGVRSFGDDPDQVRRLGAAVATGLQSVGVAACGKHFPGHGDTAVDSHLAMPTVAHDRERLAEVELVPFRGAVDAGVDALMTAHVQFPAVDSSGSPATLSREVLTGLLRDDLGYDGVVITDCMEMDAIADGVGTVEGAVRAIRAGADTVLVSHTAERQRAAIDAVCDAVRTGSLPKSRVDEAVRRVLALKQRRPGGVDDGERPSIDTATEGVVETAERVGRNAVTLVGDDADQIPLADDASALVLEFDVDRASPAEDADTSGSGLAGLLEDRGVQTRSHVVSAADPSDVEVPETAADEIVIACTYDAAGDDRQGAAVERVLSDDRPLVVVAVRNPYDRQVLSDAPTFLTTYDDSPAMVAATADVLVGEEPPRGELPVTLTE